MKTARRQPADRDRPDAAQGQFQRVELRRRQDARHRLAGQARHRDPRRVVTQGRLPWLRNKVGIVSLEDYQALKETAYLLRSPENARRLLTAIDRLENGGGTVRDLVE
jgi:hypothetical protein